jgi:hypothetical protein
VDWCTRDLQLAQQVNHAKEELLREPGRPKLISRSALGRKLGSLALIQKHLSKLPRTEALLNSAVESRIDFALRRIAQAAREIRSEGCEMKKWRLVARAGLRKDLAGEPEVIESIEDQMRLEPPRSVTREELAA